MSRSIQRRNRKRKQNTIHFICKNCKNNTAKKVENNLRVFIFCKKCKVVLEDYSK